MNSCCFICVFAVLIYKVCLQVTIEAVIGGSVVLPCSLTKDDHKPQDIDVSWIHNDSKIVLDMTPHSTSPVTQDPEYKNRTETFPQEYLRGNFSIKLNNLQHTDAGQYICYITSEYQTVQLIINDSVSTEQEDQGETEHEGIEPSLPLLFLFIILPVLFILVIIFIVVSTRKKKSAQSATGQVETM